MAKKVRTLLRVSSKQQLHDDDIPIQRGELQEFIDRQKDWVFDDEYMEKAISAYKNGIEKRDILQDILEDAKNHKFDVLLSYMSDRIGRKDEYTAYVATLNQLGVEVWTVKDGQIKTEEHIDKLLTYILFWQNEGESKKTGARVKDALKELVKTGRFVGGKAPFGYELVNSGMVSNKGRLLKTLQIVEKDAEVVRQIFNYAVYQGMGYLKIANSLNEAGIHAPEQEKWKPCTIGSILKNPIYMGYVAYNRREHHEQYTRLDRKDWIYSENQIPEFTIISPELWEKAQEIRESRKHKIAEAQSANMDAWEEVHKYPFSTKGKLPLIGLVYCGYCGKRIKNGSYCNRWTVKSTGEEKMAFSGRYTCPERHKERCNYSQNYLEGIVFEVVDIYLDNLKSIDISDEIIKLQDNQRLVHEKELKRIQREQRSIAQDIETLEENIPQALRGEGYFSKEKLSSLLDEKKEKLNNLSSMEMAEKAKLKQVTIQSEEMKSFIERLPNWKEEFHNADIATKHMILASLIDRIEVKDNDIKIKFKIRLENFLPETVGSPTPEPIVSSDSKTIYGSKILCIHD